MENFGIVHGCITTIHDVTGTQTLVDMPNHKKSDLRRARSGMVVRTCTLYIIHHTVY
jgi:glyceraldehyde 3-phosphate dehydrogenase